MSKHSCFPDEVEIPRSNKLGNAAGKERSEEKKWFVTLSPAVGFSLDAL
jgi:hypothetical protein